MGTSKKRGGAKAHRKRVQSRNQQINAQKSAMQRLFEEQIKMQIEEMKKKDQAQEAASGKSEQ
jgi:hypothetical protein